MSPQVLFTETCRQLECAYLQVVLAWRCQEEPEVRTNEGALLAGGRRVSDIVEAQNKPKFVVVVRGCKKVDSDKVKSRKRSTQAGSRHECLADITNVEPFHHAVYECLERRESDAIWCSTGSIEGVGTRKAFRVFVNIF